MDQSSGKMAELIQSLQSQLDAKTRALESLQGETASSSRIGQTDTELTLALRREGAARQRDNARLRSRVAELEQLLSESASELRRLHVSEQSLAQSLSQQRQKYTELSQSSDVQQRQDITNLVRTLDAKQTQVLRQRKAMRSSILTYFGKRWRNEQLKEFLADWRLSTSRARSRRMAWRRAILSKRKRLLSRSMNSWLRVVCQLRGERATTAIEAANRAAEGLRESALSGENMELAIEEAKARQRRAEDELQDGLLEAAQARAKVVELESDLEATRAALQRQEALTSDTVQMMATSEQSAQSLVSSNKALRDKLHFLESANSELQGDVADLKSALTKREQQISQHRATIVRLEGYETFVQTWESDKASLSEQLNLATQEVTETASRAVKYMELQVSRVTEGVFARRCWNTMRRHLLEWKHAAVVRRRAKRAAAIFDMRRSTVSPRVILSAWRSAIAAEALNERTLELEDAVVELQAAKHVKEELQAAVDTLMKEGSLREGAFAEAMEEEVSSVQSKLLDSQQQLVSAEEKAAQMAEQAAASSVELQQVKQKQKRSKQLSWILAICLWEANEKRRLTMRLQQSFLHWRIRHKQRKGLKQTLGALLRGQDKRVLFDVLGQWRNQSLSSRRQAAVEAQVAASERGNEAAQRALDLEQRALLAESSLEDTGMKLKAAEQALTAMEQQEEEEMHRLSEIDKEKVRKALSRMSSQRKSKTVRLYYHVWRHFLLSSRSSRHVGNVMLRGYQQHLLWCSLSGMLRSVNRTLHDEHHKLVHAERNSGPMTELLSTCFGPTGTAQVAVSSRSLASAERKVTEIKNSLQRHRQAISSMSEDVGELGSLVESAGFEGDGDAGELLPMAHTMHERVMSMFRELRSIESMVGSAALQACIIASDGIERVSTSVISVPDSPSDQVVVICSSTLRSLQRALQVATRLGPTREECKALRDGAVRAARDDVTRMIQSLSIRAGHGATQQYPRSFVNSEGIAPSSFEGRKEATGPLQPQKSSLDIFSQADLPVDMNAVMSGEQFAQADLQHQQEGDFNSEQLALDGPTSAVPTIASSSADHSDAGAEGQKTSASGSVRRIFRRGAPS